MKSNKIFILFRKKTPKSDFDLGVIFIS